MVITIDGPAGSGKSTAARGLAEALGIAFLDTGATYRAVTLKALRAGVDLDDEAALAATARAADIRLERDDAGRLRVVLDGSDVTADIRSEEVSAAASRIAAAPAVRGVLVDLQRRIGRQLGSFVAEGRDQGSVVFPDADVKFFLVARDEERARRREADLRAAGRPARFGDVLDSLRRRDRRDSTRAAAPLVKPPGAVEIDTTGNTIEQTRQQLLRHVESAR